MQIRVVNMVGEKGRHKQDGVFSRKILNDSVTRVFGVLEHKELEHQDSPQETEPIFSLIFLGSF